MVCIIAPRLDLSTPYGQCGYCPCSGSCASTSEASIGGCGVPSGWCPSSASSALVLLLPLRQMSSQYDQVPLANVDAPSTRGQSASSLYVPPPCMAGVLVRLARWLSVRLWLRSHLLRGTCARVALCISINDTNPHRERGHWLGLDTRRKEAGTSRARRACLLTRRPRTRPSKARHRPYSGLTGTGSTYPRLTHHGAPTGPLNRRPPARPTTPAYALAQIRTRPHASTQEGSRPPAGGARGYAGRRSWRCPRAYPKQFRSRPTLGCSQLPCKKTYRTVGVSAPTLIWQVSVYGTARVVLTEDST